MGDLLSGKQNGLLFRGLDLEFRNGATNAAPTPCLV